jgi:hypothetical protein
MQDQMIIDYATPLPPQHCPLAEHACRLGIVSGLLSVALAIVGGGCLNPLAPRSAACLCAWLGLVFLPEIAASALALMAITRIAHRGMQGLYLALLGLVTSLTWSAAGLCLLWKFITY